MPQIVAYLVLVGALAPLVFVAAKAASSRRSRLACLRFRNFRKNISVGRRQVFGWGLALPVAMFAIAALGFAVSVPLGHSAARCHRYHCFHGTTGQTTTTSGSTTGRTTTTAATTTTPTPTTPAPTTTAATTTVATTTAATTTVSTPPGSVAWRGDYGTGNFSQWWLTQFGGGNGCGGSCGLPQVGNTSASIVTAPGTSGKDAAQFRVQPCSSGCPNDRAEVLASQAEAGGYAGQDWYYGWWTYFPSGQSFWSGGGDWNDFTQFQGGGSVGGVEYLNVNSADFASPHLQLEDSGRHDLGVLQFNHWYHFIVHAKWAQDSSGIFQVYVDGNLAASVPGDNMASTGVVEISQGYYTNASSNNTVYHYGMCRATSYDAAAGC